MATNEIYKGGEGMSETYGLRQGPKCQEITYYGGYIRIEEIVCILNGNENSIERKLKKIDELEKENAELKALFLKMHDATQIMNGYEVGMSIKKEYKKLTGCKE